MTKKEKEVMLRSLQLNQLTRRFLTGEASYKGNKDYLIWNITKLFDEAEKKGIKC